MRAKVILALALFSALGAGGRSGFAQLASPFSNSVWPAQTFTATGQTGTTVQLNALVVPSTVGSSFASGTVTLTGTSLTTVTFAVYGSSDNGATFYPLPISVVASPGSTPTTTVTATGNGLYQVPLAGMTHVKFVTSGTFTATAVSLVLTASPQVSVSRNGTGGSYTLPIAQPTVLGGLKPDNVTITVNPSTGVATAAAGSAGGPAFQVAPNVIYSLAAATDQGSSTIFTDTSGNGYNATFGSPGCTWTGTGCDFSTSTSSAVNLPSAVNNDQTYCAAVNFRLYGQTGAGGTGVPSFDFLLSSATINTTGLSWLVSTSNQIYQQFSFTAAGGIETKSNEAEAGFHTICWIQGISGSSTDRFFTDGVENTYSSTGASAGSQTSGHLVFGRNNFSQPGYFDGQLYYFVGWSGQLTTAQLIAASKEVTHTVGSRGVVTTPQTRLGAYTALVAAGDSITDGFGASTPWPSLLTVSSSYNSIVNYGYYGIAVESINGQARWRDAPFCSTGANKSLAILFAGTNDVSTGTSPAQTFSYIQSYASLLQQAGCQVGVVTMLSRTGEDTNKNALNALIRAGAATGGYFVADAASLTQLGADGAYSNLTYFNSDGVHPTQSGQALLGSTISNAVNAYGIGTAGPSNPTVYSASTVSMLSADRNTTYTGATASAWTLPDCLGVTGTEYSVFNNSSGANLITFSGAGGEAITGGATVTQYSTAKFRSTLTSPSAAGCGWVRLDTPSTTQTTNICNGSISLSGTLVNALSTVTAGSATCSGANPGDKLTYYSNVPIFGVTGFAPSANGILGMNVVLTSGAVTIYLENNTASTNYTVGTLLIYYGVTR